MDVNFIITCFDREDYWPYLKDILDGYTVVKPHIAFCYNGTKNLSADFKCKNRGKLPGDADLIIGGYNVLKNNGVKNWLKLSVDSWILNEDSIVDIFDKMEKRDCCYGGCEWDDADHFSTDIMFVRENSFGLMQKFCAIAPTWIQHDNIEGLAADLAKRQGFYYMIPQRDRNSGESWGRHEVPELGWTMQHSLEKNVE